MSISDKARKLLWGHSGNRCAICKTVLVIEASVTDPDSIVGDECHIIAKDHHGPRGGEPVSDSLDRYDNLILLCKVHHKLVDDQLNEFYSDHLRSIKKEHEDWVYRTLGIISKPDGTTERSAAPHVNADITLRLQNVKEIIDIVGGAYAYDFDHDELKNQGEVDLVGVFLQQLQDWGDIWRDMEIGTRVQAQFSMRESLAEIAEAGFLVFGALSHKRVKMGEKIDTWPIALIRVIRSDNSEIIDLSKLKESLEGLEEHE